MIFVFYSLNQNNKENLLEFYILLEILVLFINYLFKPLLSFMDTVGPFSARPHNLLLLLFHFCYFFTHIRLRLCILTPTVFFSILHWGRQNHTSINKLNVFIQILHIARSVIITFSSFCKEYIISPSHLHTLVLYIPTFIHIYTTRRTIIWVFPSASLYQRWIRCDGTTLQRILFCSLYNYGLLAGYFRLYSLWRPLHRKYASSIVMRNVLNALALRYDSHGPAIERVLYFFYKTLMAAGWILLQVSYTGWARIT